MAPKKTRKPPQDSMLEEPVDDRVSPLESIGEEETMSREDRDEPESEEEQRSSRHPLRCTSRMGFPIQLRYKQKECLSNWGIGEEMTRSQVTG